VGTNQPTWWQSGGADFLPAFSFVIKRLSFGIFVIHFNNLKLFSYAEQFEPCGVWSWVPNDMFLQPHHFGWGTNLSSSLGFTSPYIIFR